MKFFKLFVLMAAARAVDVLQGFGGKGKSTLRQRLTPA
jgi:hypothetical protein